MRRIAGRSNIRKHAALAAGATVAIVAAHAGASWAIRYGVDARLTGHGRLQPDGVPRSGRR